MPKVPLVYTINSGYIDSISITDYGSAVGAKRYRYDTASLSLTEFDHTTRKVLNIMKIFTKRSNNSGWGCAT